MDWLARSDAEKGPLCNNDATTCILASPRACSGEECGDLIPSLVFPFMSLAFGMIIQPIADMTRLPYTSLLLIVGGILGVLGCTVQMALLTESLQLWAHISPPTLFFYVFLAPLVFESAFNSDSHKFSKQIFSIVVMAFLVVAIQIFIVAAWQLYVIQSPDWTLLTALVFGSMLSATDPISVTATLKAVGASENLNVLIEGESLLNDGSAFVFFEAFLEGATSPEGTTAGKVVLQVLRLSLGGMAMGIAFGLVAILFLAVIYEMFEVEVTVTIVTAFLGFWTAQSPSILSGVICNVTAGLMLSGFGKQLISPGVREPMEKFWELLSWLANTIVFVYAGLLLVAYIWSCAGDPLEWYDYVHIISWYAFLNLLRFCLTYLAYPLCRIGQPWYTWREAFVVAFSGLRGAVTLILALEVGDNQELPVSVRARTVVWSSAFVGLSLFINGTTIKNVLHMLGLDRPDPIKEEFLWRARAAMLAKTYEFLDAICVESTVKECSWYYVTQTVVPHVWLSDLDKVSRALSNSLDMRHRDSVLSSYRPSVESVRAGVRTSAVGSRVSMARESADAAGLKQRGRTSSLTAVLADDHRIDRPSREREAEMGGDNRDMAKDHRGERRTLEVHGGRQYGPKRDPEVSDAKLLAQIKELQPLASRDVGTERDVQVRQRMLQSVLGIIRSAYEVSLVNYFHIAGLEDDIKKAMDANEEGEVYNLFWYLLDHEDSMVDWSRPLDAIIGQCIDQFLGAMVRLTGRGRLLSRGRIGTSSMIVHALRRVLLEPYLRDSPLVVEEVKFKYEIFSAYLSKMEAAAPVAYSKVQTSNVVKYVFQLQQDALAAMKQNGEVDTEEAEILHNELVVLQRQTIHKRSGKAGLRDDASRRDRDILRGMPLFRPLDFETFVSLVLNRGEFLHLDMGEVAQGDNDSIVIVLRGAVRIDKESQKKCLLGKMGFNLHMGPEPITVPEEEREEAEEEVVDLELGVPMSACFGRHSVILPIDLFATNEHEVPRASTCKTYGGAMVFLLPISQALELAQLFDWFRAELARHVVRLTMFGFLQARGIWTHLVDHPDDDPENTRLTQAAVTAATHVIQALPYSSLIGITKEDQSTTIQGPAVLLQGRVRVRSKNLRSIRDDSPHWDVYIAPSILPADVLGVELAEPAEGDDAMNIAEIMVQELATEDVIAEDRIRRWNGPPELIEANGRFGLHKVFELDLLLKQLQDTVRRGSQVNGVDDDDDDLKKPDGGENGLKDDGET